MRFARSFLALAALCAAAACADGASRITAPSAPSHDGGAWIGSGNVTTSDTTAIGGGWIGSGNVTGDGGAGTATESTDTTSTRIGGGWIGSGN